MGFNKGVEEQMIILIEIIMYAVICFILSTITVGLIFENIRLNKECREVLTNFKEFEKEARFKLNIR